MAVAPHPQHLRGLPVGVDLVIDETGHRSVVEADAHGRGRLLDRQEVLDVQQIVGRRNPEAADLGRPAVAEP
jgi:hypothetical protein